MVHPVAEAEALQQGPGPRLPGATRAAGVDRGDLDVGLGAEIRHQVVALEDEAEVLAAELRQLVRIHVRGVAPGYAV